MNSRHFLLRKCPGCLRFLYSSLQAANYYTLNSSLKCVAAAKITISNFDFRKPDKKATLSSPKEAMKTVTMITLPTPTTPLRTMANQAPA